MIRTAPTEEAISVLAHKFWEEEGRPEGRAESHWLRAVAELNIPAVTPVAVPAQSKKKSKR
jgi:hypothetical protein